ncbi:MAG: hypothetical protein KDJ14_06715 [Xanthomonadales bacterium]|nr:hypothetical protein [Xanthomonadales bacterium]
MWRRLFQLALVALLVAAASGCATTYEYYGDERYHEPVGGVVYDSYPDEGGYAYSGSSAYYDAGYGYYEDPDWYAYPAYYSMFWSLNRWYVDPYWHPSFYYGVTFFPRHYFAVSFRHWPSYSGYAWWPPYYRYVPYAPYRGAWFDYYYDWTPWYAYHPHIQHHYAPRYGNVRNETERLSHWSRRGDSYQQWRVDDRNISFQREPGQLRNVRDRTEYYRGATSSDRNAVRSDPDVRGFSGSRDARSGRPASNTRVDPGVRGFSAPSPDRSASRGSLPSKPYTGTRSSTVPTDRPAERGSSDAGVPIVRRTPTPTRDYQRSNTERSARYGEADSYRRERPVERVDREVSRQPSTRQESSGSRWSVPAPSSARAATTPTPSYRQPTEPRGYTPRSLERPATTPRVYSAPAPASRDYSRSNRSEPSRPTFESRTPAPQRSAPPRSEPRPERSERESRNEDDGKRERGRR